jgi:hypothetical protein
MARQHAQVAAGQSQGLSNELSQPPRADQQDPLAGPELHLLLDLQRGRSGSVKTAASSVMGSERICKFTSGMVVYSAWIPSRLAILSTVRFSQWVDRPFRHCSQAPHTTLISPTTRLPTHPL